jgi:hypothetical protein
MSTTHTRQPAGVPIGGQFAAQSNPEPEVDLDELDLDTSFLSPISPDEQEEMDYLVPQANRPERIFSVVDSVAAGCVDSGEIGVAIGMSERQGAYYAHAARTLGLVERSDNPVGYYLTQRGSEVVLMSDPDRVEALSQVLSENAQVVAYVDDGAEALTASWGSELSDSTVQRRLSTVKSWSGYLFSGRDKQTALMETSRSETCQRAPAIVAARPKPVQVRRCPKCYLELPSGSDLCNLCD